MTDTVSNFPLPSTVGPLEPARVARQWNWLVLCAAIGVLLLSRSLQLISRHDVVFPLLGTPLPHLCLWKSLSGFSCPGCGLTRSFISLAHGEFLRAWQFNPAGLPFFAMVVFQIPYRSLQLRRLHRGESELRLKVFIPGMCVVLMLALLGQWAVRTFLEITGT